ncbi:hypothetical protein Corgl_0079 [Coriobacterium glomerans PW2]|uniref:Uncharacterized protein n=1 Tax=Coriobacterium glomerans (strain ATCC 49209 / DSM 20642 / JCM 10262 / PW2) TaxID=700015 RepID=F2N9V2_CORGP|nr:ATP-dependent sacrificial sulfur transferase LarE [Coriobacterium glomerans]AEB06207.1 hypothetical protein Corgl_0079 [Coriobacterium glomerans PW2]
MRDKLRQLHVLLRSFGSIAIGFSGGVDSAFLAAVCARIMADRTLLIHLSTPLVGTPEERSFQKMTKNPDEAQAIDGRTERGAVRRSATVLCALPLPVVEVALDPLADPDIARNDEARCYHCKLAGFARIVSEARKRGYAVVADGSNADDAGDYRPGMRAISELGVRSPLLETGWHKEEERELLRAWGYPVWNLPSGACLATRIATGERLTAGRIEQIRTCEDLLEKLGLSQVRARLVGDLMRIEAAPADLARLRAVSAEDASDGRAPTSICPLGGTDDDGAVALPADVLQRLGELIDIRLDPFAHPYRKGDMNAQAKPFQG